MMSSFPLIRKTLPSGLRTILLPRDDVATVTFLVLIGVGSRYETPRQWGLSHFHEHMFFKGTETRPTTKEISEALDGVGAEYNAFTSEEYTGFYVKLAAEHLYHGAEVVSDIVLRPLFPKEEIERERSVITEEIRMYTDSPASHVSHLWQHALFGNHPLGRRIDGSEVSIAALQRNDFVSWTHTHYQTGNAVVAVAGHFREKKVASLLRELFRPLPYGRRTKPLAAPSKVPRTRFVHERRGHLDQTHVMVGVPGVSLKDKRRFAAELLAVILGGGMSSRLFLTVRERNGLAYRIQTSSDIYTDAGSFVTTAGLRTDKTAEALKLIMEEYDRVTEELVSNEELHKAKQMIQGQMVLQLEETNTLAMFAAGQELLSGEIKKPDELLKISMSVTPQEIRSVAQSLLAKKKRAIALLSPHTSTRAFERFL